MERWSEYIVYHSEHFWFEFMTAIDENVIIPNNFDKNVPKCSRE